MVMSVKDFELIRLSGSVGNPTTAGDEAFFLKVKDPELRRALQEFVKASSAGDVDAKASRVKALARVTEADSADDADGHAEEFEAEFLLFQ